jgi:hypothetical protein
VIDVPDRPDIYVRLAAVKFLFCHIPAANYSSLLGRK